MIDVEADVFEFVSNSITAEHPGTFVSGEYVEVPASFPAVTIMESDNRVLNRMRTVKIENAAYVMYECNVYSNKVGGKKSEAKSIADTMDSAFEQLGFTRTFRDQIANLRDATIYRIVSRYEAVVGPGESGKFLIYQN